MEEIRRREFKLRRQAQRLGYSMHKSRDRSLHSNNRGGFQLVDVHRNTVVEGVDYDLELDDVARILDDFAARRVVQKAPA